MYLEIVAAVVLDILRAGADFLRARPLDKVNPSPPPQCRNPRKLATAGRFADVVNKSKSSSGLDMDKNFSLYNK